MRQHKVQSEEFRKHISIAHGNHLLHHKENDVDEEEIARDGGDIFEHREKIEATILKSF